LTLGWNEWQKFPKSISYRIQKKKIYLSKFLEVLEITLLKLEIKEDILGTYGFGRRLIWNGWFARRKFRCPLFTHNSMKVHSYPSCLPFQSVESIRDKEKIPTKPIFAKSL